MPSQTLRLGSGVETARSALELAHELAFAAAHAFRDRIELAAFLGEQSENLIGLTEMT